MHVNDHNYNITQHNDLLKTLVSLRDYVTKSLAAMHVHGCIPWHGTYNLSLHMHFKGAAKPVLRMCDIRFVRTLGSKQIPNCFSEWVSRLFEKIYSSEHSFQASSVFCSKRPRCACCESEREKRQKTKLVVEEAHTTNILIKRAF